MKRSKGCRPLILSLILMMVIGTLGIPAFAVTPVWDSTIDFEALEGPIGLLGTPSTEDVYDFFFVGWGEIPVVVDNGGNHILKDPSMDMYGAETVFLRQGGANFSFKSLDINILNGGSTPAPATVMPGSVPGGNHVEIYAIDSGMGWHKFSLFATSSVFDTITSDDLGITGMPLYSLHINIVSIWDDYSIDNVVLSSEDNTPPVVTATPDRDPNLNGWYNNDVTIHFSATDDLSGVDESTITPDVIVSTEGQDQLIEGYATDFAGNMGTGSIKLSIDKTAPTVTMNSIDYIGTGTIDLGYIATGYDKEIPYTAADAISGLTGTIPSVPAGNFEIPTSTAGMNQTAAFDIYDNAGNLTTITFNYHVISLDDLINLLDPVSHKGVYNKNSNIPIKLQIMIDTDDDGIAEPKMMSAEDLTFCLQLFDGNGKMIKPTRTNTVSALKDCEFTLNGPDYDTYQYNLNTKGLSIGDYTLKIYIMGKEGTPEGLVGTQNFTLR